MAPLACARCGSLGLATLSDDLQRSWALEEGAQWTSEGNLAYWRLRLPCHRAVQGTLQPTPLKVLSRWLWLQLRRAIPTAMEMVISIEALSIFL